MKEEGTANYSGKNNEASTDSSKIEKLFISEIAQKLKEHPDIMFKLFTFLPPKDLYKFKCVSKGFRRLIEEPIFKLEHFKRLKAISPLTGFFYQKFDMYQFEKPVFFATPYIDDDDDSKLLPDSSLDYLKVDKNWDTITVFESCDGLLLCADYIATSSGFYCICYVHNPLTMEKVVLHHCYGSIKDCLQYSLFTQASSSGYIQYKVICIYGPKCDQESTFSKLVIFSSKTGKWEKINGELPPLSDSSKVGLKVVIKDVMFWDCFEGNILVFYFNKSKTGRWYDLIKSPKAEFRRVLWEYEGNLHCYCHGYEQEEEYPVWVLCSNDNKFEGRKGDSEQFKNLAEDVWNGCHKTGKIVPKVVSPVRYEILTYDPNLKKVYLWITDAIFSYEFTERKFEYIYGVFNQKFIPVSYVLPYVHCMMPMEIGGTKTDQEEDNQSIICSHESSTARSTRTSISRKKKKKKNV